MRPFASHPRPNFKRNSKGWSSGFFPRLAKQCPFRHDSCRYSYEGLRATSRRFTKAAGHARTRNPTTDQRPQNDSPVNSRGAVDVYRSAGCRQTVILNLQHISTKSASSGKNKARRRWPAPQACRGARAGSFRVPVMPTIQPASLDHWEHGLERMTTSVNFRPPDVRNGNPP